MAKGMEQVTGPDNKNFHSPSRWLYAAWVFALIGTIGSLFFSEVMLYPPCVLCWYQRIALYPLVVIIGIGVITRDRSVYRYSIAFCLIGLAIAVYHNLLYFGLIPESITPCTEGVPCNAKQLEMFGFITIPLMALAGFAGILFCLIFSRPKNNL